MLEKPSEKLPRLIVLIGVALLTTVAVFVRTEGVAVVISEYPEPVDRTLAIEAQIPVPEHSYIAKIAPIRHDGSVGANVVLGKIIASQNGIIGNEWECLYQLGIRESGWNNTATNPTSGAYGIPQSLPASKMASHGDIHDPTVQIEWMIDYVFSRYGTSCNADRFQRVNGWY